MPTTYYVAASDGNNTYNGTVDHHTTGSNGPFLTITKAASVVAAGDTVQVRTGTYQEGVTIEADGTSGSHITFTCYPSESPVINGNWTIPAGNIYLFLVNINGDYVDFSHFTVENSAGGLLAIAGAHSTATYITGAHSMETGMVAGGSYNTLDHCSMTDNGAGMDSDGAHYDAGQGTWGSAICTVGDHNTISNCVSHDNRGEGINSYSDSTYSTIFGNIAYDNQSYNLYLDSVVNASVYGNLVYQTVTAYDMYGIAIGAESGQPSYIDLYNNIVMGCKANFQMDSNVTGWDHIRIMYNTFVNSTGAGAYTWGVIVRDDASTWTASIFKDNIVIEETEGRTPILCPASHTGLTFSYNCWNQTPDTDAAGTGDVTADPKIAKAGLTTAGNLTSAYFALQSDSPAIDAGNPITGITTDYAGLTRPSGSQVDMGALEYDQGAKIYYVKNGGDDDLDGLSDGNAWETISKVNGETFNPDDQILFKRGSTWRETLTVPSSGTANHPLILGKYGTTGADPIISGGILKNAAGNWTNEPGAYDWEYDSEEALPGDWTSETDTASKLARSTDAAAIRVGTAGIDVTVQETAAYLSKTVPANTTSWYNRIYFKLSSDWGVHDGFTNTFYTATRAVFGTVLALFFKNVSGNAKLRGSMYAPSTADLDGSTTITKNAWHYLDIAAIGLASASGSIIVSLDGTPELSWTAKDMSSVHGNVDTINLGLVAADNWDLAGHIYYDDGWFDIDGSGAATNYWYLSSITADPNTFVHDDVLGAGTQGSNPRKTLKASLAAQWDYWYDDPNDRFYIYSTANPTTLATTLEIASLDTNLGTISTSYVTLSNLQFKLSRNTAALSWGAVGVIFDGCDFKYSGRIGIQFNNGGAGTVNNCAFTDWGTEDYDGCFAIHVIKNGATQSGPVTVTNNTFSQVRACQGPQVAGIVIDDGGKSSEISGNTLTNIYVGAGISIYQPGGITTLNVHDNSLTNVRGIALEASNLEVNGGTPTINFYRNIVTSSCMADAIDVEAIRLRNYTTASHVSVYYNIINGTYDGTNAHHGIQNKGADGSKIWNNVIYGCDNGIEVTDLDADHSTGLDVRNNLVLSNRGYGLNLAASNTITTWGYNCWYGNVSGALNGKAAGTGDVTSDPKVTTAGTDFSLQASSPCRNAGASVGLTTDYLGNPVPATVGGTPDVGAYEYVATGLATVTTTAASSIAATSAAGGGNVTDTGDAPVTARGVCWSTSANPTTASSKTSDSTGTGVFTSTLATLVRKTVYHVRAYATNSIGTAYGSDVQFTTLATAPVVTTTAVTAITSASATSGGAITDTGGDTITAKGVCWNTSANPTTSNSKTSDGPGATAWASSITGLSESTTYHVRAYATNDIGTSYGADREFDTVAFVPVGGSPMSLGITLKI